MVYSKLLNPLLFFAWCAQARIVDPTVDEYWKKISAPSFTFSSKPINVGIVFGKTDPDEEVPQLYLWNHRLCFWSPKTKHRECMDVLRVNTVFDATDRCGLGRLVQPEFEPGKKK